MEETTTPPEDFKCAVYLKFHLATINSLKCLNVWIEVFLNFPYPVFILCDIEQERLEALFLEGILSRVIRSDEGLRERFVDRLPKHWVNAGAAHMTTFLHAKQNGFTHYWNIDADDTIFLHEPAAIAKKLAEVQTYALAHKLDCFSLDMYQTFQRHWSFGVTFTSLTNVDYFGVIKKINGDELAEAYKPEHEGRPTAINNLGVYIPGSCGNIDWYFTYMRDQGLINAKSFYIEDTYFAHIKSSAVLDEIGQLMHGIYRWKNGMLWAQDIAPDCVRFPAL